MGTDINEGQRQPLYDYEATYYIGKKSKRPYTVAFKALDDDNATEMAMRAVYQERGYPNTVTITDLRRIS